MKERFDAGPNAQFVIDDAERKRWESFGLVDHDAQDRVFQEMARAVASLTAGDPVSWQSASSLLDRESEPHSPSC